MKENWKNIADYEGYYQISDLGRVKSLERNVVDKNGFNFHVSSKILKPTPDNGGYMRVDLIKNGTQKCAKVHRLVGEAFIPNPLDKPQINHIDGIKNNNVLSNLEWNTRSENLKHAYKMGLNVRSEDAGKKKTPVYQIKDGKIINKFETINEAERKTDTPRQNIRKVINGQRKMANGYQWADAE